MNALLELDDVSVAHGGRLALRGVDLSVVAGESIGLVGRSGSGKSTAARCLAGLLRPSGGRVLFEGRDVRQVDRRTFHRAVQLVPQDCAGALDRRTTVGRALWEPAVVHGIVRRSERERYAHELLDLVRLPAAMARRMPGELSGGEVQRVVIARALSLRPRVLIADEAVSALDPLARAQIMNLCTDLRDELGLALVFIDHDLRLVTHVAERVVVLHDGAEVARGSDLRASADVPEVAELLRAASVPPA